MAKKKVQTKDCAAKWHAGTKTLPLSNFPRWVKSKDSHSPWCHQCWGAYVADRSARAKALADGGSYKSPITGREYLPNGKPAKAEAATRKKTNGKVKSKK